VATVPGQVVVPMNPIERAVRRVDVLQQRHKAPAFVFGIIKKYGDDNGGKFSTGANKEQPLTTPRRSISSTVSACVSFPGATTSACGLRSGRSRTSPSMRRSSDRSDARSWELVPRWCIHESHLVRTGSARLHRSAVVAIDPVLHDQHEQVIDRPALALGGSLQPRLQ
jgi:hypothetical protein